MRKKYMGLILIFIIAIIFRLINLIDFHSLESDEALYAQVVSLLSKGFLPYRDIFVGHPPLYFYIAVPFYWIVPHLYSIRLFNVILSVAILYLLFLLCRLAYSERVATFTLFIYAVYPFAIYSSKLILVDNAVALFTALAALFLVQYIRKNNLRYVALSGFVAGVSCMTKFTGIFFFTAIFLFTIFRIRRVGAIIFFVLGFIIFPLLTLLSLLYTGIWEVFYAQTIAWQFIRFGLYPTEKLWFGIQGIVILSPLIVSALLKARKGDNNVHDELMFFLFLIPLIFILLFKVIFLQYFIALLIPLCVLTARFIVNSFHANFSFSNNHLLTKRKYSKKSVIKATILIVTIFFCWNLNTKTC